MIVHMILFSSGFVRYLRYYISYWLRSQNVIFWNFIHNFFFGLGEGGGRGKQNYFSTNEVNQSTRNQNDFQKQVFNRQNVREQLIQLISTLDKEEQNGAFPFARYARYSRRTSWNRIWCRITSVTGSFPARLALSERQPRH